MTTNNDVIFILIHYDYNGFTIVSPKDSGEKWAKDGLAIAFQEELMKQQEQAQKWRYC